VLELQGFEKTVGESRRVEDRTEEQKASPRIFLAGRIDQDFTYCRIAGKASAPERIRHHGGERAPRNIVSIAD